MLSKKVGLPLRVGASESGQSMLTQYLCVHLHVDLPCSHLGPSEWALANRNVSRSDTSLPLRTPCLSPLLCAFGNAPGGTATGWQNLHYPGPRIVRKRTQRICCALEIRFCCDKSLKFGVNLLGQQSWQLLRLGVKQNWELGLGGRILIRSRSLYLWSFLSRAIRWKSTLLGPEESSWL